MMIILVVLIRGIEISDDEYDPDDDGNLYQIVTG